MKYRNAGVYAEKLKMTYCGVDCCKECRRIGDCGGCEACKGHPFGGSCVTERNEHFSALKKQLIDEINALHMEELEIRHSTIKRRRIRTVIDNLILIAGHLTDHARKLRLSLGRCNGWICTFLRVAKSV